MLKFVYPELGVPLPDRSYADNCDLTMDNMKVSHPDAMQYFV